MDVPGYVAFPAVVTVLVIVPGPDMMMILAVGMRGGPAAGLMAAFGVAAGLSLHTCAVVLGLSALFAALLPAYHLLLRWAGAGYLLHLAVRAFRERWVPELRDGPATRTSGRSRAGAFWQGMAVNLLNPKVILFNVTFLPSFVRPDTTDTSGFSS
jgi:threonine/homoserine/homoserine lactone efflux protein